MAETFHFDVFLSHSSKDQDVVREVAEGLRREGLKVWLDAWAIKPGDSIPAKIEEGLGSARVLLLFMSQHALGSDWTALEGHTFRFRDPLNKERHFIPMRLDDVEPKGSLKQFLYIDWRPADKPWRQLRAACRPATSLPSPAEETLGQRLEEKIVHLPTVRLNSIAWSPDGRRVLSGASDKTLRLWDVDSGQCLRVFEGHTNYVRSVAWSPDGRTVLSGTNDNTVRLWDIDSGQCLRVFKGHTGTVWSIAWSPDGRRALWAAGDQPIRLWDVDSGRCLRVLKGYTRAVGASPGAPMAAGRFRALSTKLSASGTSAPASVSASLKATPARWIA